MSTVQTVFSYSVTDINNSVRRTNVFLRAANAIRHTYNDINRTMKNPSFANIMWTLIQISRTYNALRRLQKLIVAETNKVGAVINFIIPEAPTVKPPTDAFITPPPLSMRVDAFLDNRPVRLDRIDLSNLPEATNFKLQALMEEDAEETVVDAQEILTARIKDHNASTGDLSASIGWMREVFGVRIFANMYYSAWVEEGHDAFTGHHYMRGAVDLARQRLPNKIREELNQLISDGL